MNIRFLSKGPPDQISGGFLYNRYLLDYLRRAGRDVTYHDDPANLEDIAPADTLIVDSLVIGETAQRLLALPANLVLLLHVVPDLRALAGDRHAVLRSLCRRSRLIVTGDSTLTALRRAVADADLDAVKIEPGVPAGWCAKAGYAPKATQLLGAANYVRGKGIVGMLGVLYQLRHLPWSLTWHGNRDLDPDYFAAVASKVEEYGLADRVDIQGPVSHTTINRKMLGADLLVQLSLRESYSMVTAEAIACGLPVLSYRTGNCAAFGRSGLVRYLDGGDTSAAATLGALIEDEQCYAQLRRTGAWEPRTCEDVGREFLAWLERQ